MTELLRPDSGEGDRTYVLDAEVGDEKLRKIAVSVPEQELSEEEASALLDQAQVELERWAAAIPNPEDVYKRQPLTCLHRAHWYLHSEKCVVRVF